MKSGNNEITRKKAEKEKKEKDNAETQSVLGFAETKRRGLTAKKQGKKKWINRNGKGLVVQRTLRTECREHGD